MTNQIICGDATTTLATLSDGSVDLIVTDPPYLCRYRDRTGRTIANDDSPDIVLKVFPELYRVLVPNRYCILFCGWSSIPGFAAAWDAAGLRTAGHIVWTKRYTSSAKHVEYRHESAWVLTKGSPRPSDNPLPDVQRWVYSGNRHHPTEKAVEVMAPLIESFSQPGDVVLDPFLGSGTTAVAAALQERHVIGVELEADYCAIAEQRLAEIEDRDRDMPGDIAARMGRFGAWSDVRRLVDEAAAYSLG